MTTTIPRGKISLYGCGGAGMNIVQRYEPLVGQDVPGVATITPYYVDSSYANLKDGIDDSRLFVLEDKEGSGKVRTENRVEISRAIGPVLSRQPPADVNIVVFSASGGTGSVFGPLLMAKLLETGQRSIAIVIGTDECERSATNTLNTLKSLEGIAQKTQKTVMMYYEHLRPTDKRSTIDDRIAFVISALSHLASRRNRELDLKDIANFIDFTAHTSVAPQLSVLEVYRTLEEANTTGEWAMALASLLDNPDAPSVEFRPEYRCTGYPSDGLPNGVKSLHFVAGVEPVHGMFKNLSRSTDAIVSAKQARSTRDSIVNSSETDGDGMVF